MPKQAKLIYYQLFLFLTLLHYKITDYKMPHLYYRPVVRLAQQLDDSWNAIVQPDSILGQFSVLVAGSEVTKGAHCWLSNVLLLPSTKHSMDQCFHPTILSHQSLRKRNYLLEIHV